ncbi:MAG: hypothetical protein AAGU11_03450 [Syntrophobacteraceae bacterium]
MTKKRSSRAAVFLSLFLFITGSMALSPSAGFTLMSLAAASAIIPTIYGQRSIRLIGIILLALSVALGTLYFPPFKKEQREFSQKWSQRSN